MVHARPDIIEVSTPPDDDANGSRKRGREEEPPSKRPSKEPSHLVILQESAESMRTLYALVDDLSRRNQELERRISAP